MNETRDGYGSTSLWTLMTYSTWISTCDCSFRVTTSREDQFGLCQLAQLTDLNLSYNFLAGDIPTCLMHILR